MQEGSHVCDLSEWFESPSTRNQLNQLVILLGCTKKLITLEDFNHFFQSFVFDVPIEYLEPTLKTPQKILDILGKLPLKKAVRLTEKEMKNTDVIVLCGGQAITMLENRYTFNMLTQSVLYSIPHVISFGHVPKNFPTTKCFEDASQAMFPTAHRSIPKDTSFARYDSRIYKSLFYHRVDGTMVNTTNTTYTRYGFHNLQKSSTKVLETCKRDFADRPLNITVISTQPEQALVIFKKTFSDTDHTVHVAYVPHPKIGTIKQAYWDETDAHRAAFALRDLAKVIYELCNKDVD